MSLIQVGKNHLSIGFDAAGTVGEYIFCRETLNVCGLVAGSLKGVYFRRRYSTTAKKIDQYQQFFLTEGVGKDLGDTRFEVFPGIDLCIAGGNIASYGLG